MNDLVLALNAGSSSLKFAVFAADNSSTLAEVRGEISGIGRLPNFSARTAEGDPVEPDALVSLDASLGHERLLDLLLSWIGQHVGDRIVAVGHRVVHGGRHFVRPALVTDDVVDRLEALTSMAPLHQPHNIAAIRSVAAWRPDLPQVACFDTSFHRTQPRLSQLFALPRALTEEGIIRYGFHGLSYEYIAGVLPEKIGELADGRVVVAHLGNGSSMCAMRHRKSVATSMGFSALDGLVMGRRCGALDPGVVLHLMRQKSMDADTIEDLLYRRSGLLGVSGISNNMHELLVSSDPRAREAIDLYCERAAGFLSGLLASIGGLDAVVFTAGIGANAAPVRQAICDRLDWLGIALDEAANAANACVISSKASRVRVLVVPTNEEAIVANACRQFVGLGNSEAPA